MIAFGKTKTEAGNRISEGLGLLNSFFREREDWQEEATRYLESRGVEYQIRTENDAGIETDDGLETVEMSMSFGSVA